VFLRRRGCCWRGWGVEVSSSGRKYLLIVSVGFAWAIISVHPIWKYLSHAEAAAAFLLGLVMIVLGMRWLNWLNRRQRQISLGWFGIVFVVLVAAFAVLYPISLRHTLNSGSDREDALRVELNAVVHHSYPYDARTFLGNPPSPLPGAMLLAAPFFAVGHIAWQNLFWLALFFFFAVRFFDYRATALLFLAVFVLLAPANLSDLTAGGDYVTNFFYFSIAVALFARSLGCSYLVCIPAALFLGVTLSSRVVYGFALIPLLALTLQRTSLFRAVVLFVAVLAGAAAVTVPILAPHFMAHFVGLLNQNSYKLRYIPAALHPEWTLPLLAVIASSTAFFMRMDLPRFFLTFSVASFAVLAPSAVTLALSSGRAGYVLSYLAICVLSFCLWALSRYERLEMVEGLGG
jgi:hypothetical protein